MNVGSHDLYKLPNGEYVVTSFKLKKPYRFLDVEGAALALVEVGVPEDEIDTAIAYMAINADSHAQFGTLNGFFIFTDKEPLPVVPPPPVKS